MSADRVPVLLNAYDTSYPEPLRSKRPLPDSFAVALVLTRGPDDRYQREAHRWPLYMPGRPPTRLDGAATRGAARRVPAARSLPLLRAARPP